MLCFALILVVSLAGCCPEPEDHENGSSVTGGYQLPPGPDVILEPVGVDLVWKVDGTLATGGDSVFDKAKPDSYCKLRKDFIGKEILYYRYIPDDQTAKRDANDINLESGDIQLTIKRGSSGLMDWWIKNKNTGKSCTLKEGAVPSNILVVPAEFMGLTHNQATDKFEETWEKKDAEQLDLQVKYESP